MLTIETGGSRKSNAAASTKLPNGSGMFGALFAEMGKEIKATTSAWELVSARAGKLSAQLGATGAALGAFCEALQTLSDHANNANGISRDIGASLTRFCLRQRAIEQHMRQFGAALHAQFSGQLERKSGEWRQTVSDLERRHQRNCKRVLKGSSGGSSSRKNQQQFEAESRSAFVDLLHVQRAQFAEFVAGALVPVIDAELALLDEGAHVRAVHESLKAAIGENDAHTLIQALLEDISCSATDRGHTLGRRALDDELRAWDERVGVGMAQSRTKSASQARLCVDADEDAYSLYGSTLCHNNNTTSVMNRNSAHSVQLGASNGSTFGANQQDERPHTISHAPPAAVTAVATISTAGRHRASIPGTFVAAHQQSTASLCSSASRNSNGEGSAASVPASPMHQQPATVGAAGGHKPPYPRRPTVQQQQSIGRSTAQHHYANAAASVASGASAFSTSSCASSSLSASITSMEQQHQSSFARATVADSDSHCSGGSSAGRQSALIAETLQQIDRLGAELDTYCEGLGDEHDDDNNCPPTPPPPIRFRPDALALLQQQQQNRNNCCAVAPQLHTQQMPQSARQAPPPPLPPARRNSAISAATPTAPSIVDLRLASGIIGTPVAQQHFYSQHSGAFQNSTLSHNQHPMLPLPIGCPLQSNSGRTVTDNNIPPSPCPVPANASNSTSFHFQQQTAER